MSRIFQIAAALAAAVVLAPFASADPGREAVSIAVDYSDLDLSRPAGVKTLMSRLDAASKQACGARPMQVRYGQLERYLRCRSSAVEGAVRRIDEPAVTTAFENSIGRKPVRLASR